MLATTEDAVDSDFDCHAVGVLPGRTVSGFERVNRQLDRIRVSDHVRGSFHCQPAGPVDLADRCKPVRLYVPHLPGAVRTDDPDQSAPGVIPESDGDHVGGVVSAQRRQGGEMPLGEKSKFVSGEVGGVSHLRGRYLGRHLA